MSKELTPEIIEDLKAKHDELHALTANGVTVVVTPPTRASWQRFVERVTDDAKRYGAIEQLVRDCTVFPDTDELDKILTRYPAFSANVVLPELNRLAGAAEEVHAKKL